MSESKVNVGRELLQSPHESLVAGCRQLYTALLLRVLEERVIATPRYYHLKCGNEALYCVVIYAFLCASGKSGESLLREI